MRMASSRKRNGELPSTVLLRFRPVNVETPTLRSRADSGAFHLAQRTCRRKHQNPSRIYPSFQPLAQCPRATLSFDILANARGVGDRFRMLKIYFNCGGDLNRDQPLAGSRFYQSSHGAARPVGVTSHVLPSEPRCSRSSGAAVTPMRRAHRRNTS